METTSEGTPKKPTRHGSGRAMPRRSTRGPLDVSDSPLQTSPVTSPTPSNNSVFPLPSSHQQLLSPISLSSNQSQFTSPHLSSPSRTPRLPSPTPGSNISSLTYRTAPSHQGSVVSNYQNPAKDFGYLLRPEIYHPLTLLDVPPPFRVPKLQPDPATPIGELVKGGNFRSAAIKAAQLLTTTPINPADHETIFSLVYTRLSCLTLCNATPLAAQEVKSLEDLNSSYYLDDLTSTHLVPWELRVLAVRLQSMGFNDARRGVMGYYDLAREARLQLTSLKKTLFLLSSQSEKKKEDEEVRVKEEIAMWESRLEDLGIRTASALIEIQDLEGAAHFLKSLNPATPSLKTQKALLWLYIGDVEAARKSISESLSTSEDSPSSDSSYDLVSGSKVIEALATMCEGEYVLASPIWEALISNSENEGEKAIFRQNLAVCLLYLGKLSEARTLMEELVQEGNSWKALTFNLATIFELCTERSRALKIGLVEQIAKQREEGGGEGREGVNADYKL